VTGYIAGMSSSLPSLPIRLIDDGRGTFGPLTDLRPVYALRAGLGTIAERIEAKVGAKVVAVDVPAAVRDIAQEELQTSSHGATASAAQLVMEQLVVNARLLSLDVLDGLQAGESRYADDGTFLAARVPTGAAPTAAKPGAANFKAQLAGAPWDITTRIATTLAEDLELFRNAPVLANCERRALRPDEGQSFGTHPILIDRTATVGPLCVIDASKGPVVIGAGVVVRPFAVLVGPCAILDGSTVAERSLIKASTVIGPHCRAGGEIGGTIFQAYSNKSHDGHLGDSFVGEWVNIGAGSDNSNLLNTYGEVIVRLEADGGLTRTGRQFWGAVIGDHVKLAIGTRLMTGTTIGTGAMIACSRSPATLVPRFSWLTDSADGPKSFRIDKFLETARAMMSRRGKAPTPAVEAAIRALHAKATGA